MAIFKDSGWLGALDRVLSQHNGGLPISDAYDLLADWAEDHPDVQRRMILDRVAIRDLNELRKERDRKARDEADEAEAAGWVKPVIPGMEELLPKLPRRVEVAPNREKDLLSLRNSDIRKHLNIVDNRATQAIDGAEEYRKDEHRKWDPILSVLPDDDSRTLGEVIEEPPALGETAR